MIRTQIAGISKFEDALAAIEAGADALGFTLRLPGGQHERLDDDGAREIVRLLPPFVSKVLVTYLNVAPEAAELVRYLGLQAIQFHGEVAVREVKWFRREAPGVKIIKSIIVRDEQAVEDARFWEEWADALITDTFDPETGKTGATGMIHDWSISRRIVETVEVPVILAGGLKPDNVAEAVRAVRPWGVDVHTGVEREDGSFDPVKARQFVLEAESV